MSVTTYQKISNGATVASYSASVVDGKLTVGMGSTAASASYRMDPRTGALVDTMRNKTGTTTQTITVSQTVAYRQAVVKMKNMVGSQMLMEKGTRNKVALMKVYAYLRQILSRRVN